MALIVNWVKQMIDRGGQLAADSSTWSGSRRLLRQSHIFGSALREVLEERVLGEVTPHPLSVAQFHILRVMTLNGHHRVQQVADFLGVSAPAASKNIDKLVKLGLLERIDDADDRRVTLLAASRTARRIVRNYEKRVAQVLEPVLEQFTPDELDDLTDLLRRFSTLIYQQRKPETGFCLRCAAYGESGCAIGHMQGFCPYEQARGGSEVT